MLSSNLKRWIAESQSWQMTLDYKLSQIAKYKFLDRKDDFYISLFGKSLKIFNQILNNETSINNSQKKLLLPLAKGLEIFSLEEKRNSFEGISYSHNLLFVSGLYSLADYEMSAYLLSKLFYIK